MGYREERVAKNEATSRVINEGVEVAFESEPQDALLFFICECGLEQCDRTVRITKAEYERVRSDPRQFVIFRNHLIPDVEQVVSDGDTFLVVAKREGTQAEVAIHEDPGLRVLDRRLAVRRGLPVEPNARVRRIPNSPSGNLASWASSDAADHSCPTMRPPSGNT
jgi:hypothetical protein